MKVCIVQPPYSTDFSESEKYFQWEMDAFDRCDDSMDLIVFPEATDIPCMAHSAENVVESYTKFFDPLYQKAIETAKRCNAIVFFNAHNKTEKGLYNTTFAIDRQGNLAGIYNKQHLTPKEVAVYHMVSDYSFEHSAPTVIEIEGLRYCFLTCYDFYFYEAFPAIARQKPDIIIGCSHQRSDKQSALETMSRFCAYNCNAYIVRSSVSMGEETDIGGGSCVVSPDGEVLVDMKSRVGMETVEINPSQKYYKPAGFGNLPASHFEYVEAGRRPWKYRPAGSAIVLSDGRMSYPRVCAHRGFNTVAPENSLPAFGAAVAMGAEEIEFDLWFTKDGEVVSIHDSTLERVSNGTGNVWEYTLEELRALDFGGKMGEKFEGMTIPMFEDILKKFACHCVMNIHLKTAGDRPEYLDKVVRLIQKYDCEKYVYFMSGQDAVLERRQREYPHITRCCGAGDGAWEIVDRAIRYGCKKVQLFKPYFNQEMIDKAHEHGIACNVFWSDDAKETEEFLRMGIDTILTNDYHLIAKSVENHKRAVN